MSDIFRLHSYCFSNNYWIDRSSNRYNTSYISSFSNNPFPIGFYLGASLNG